VDEEGIPEAYRSVIRRLRMASESGDIQMEMEMEDDYLKELQDKERLVAQHEKALEEQKKKNEEQRKVIEDRDRVIKELKKQLAEQQKQK
jgi:hypothetical protein